jgi:hypothetical protein
MQPLKVFIGFDPRAHVAYHACHNSIFSRCSKPVLTGPLVLPTLPITKTGLTQFTYTRFLVPHLCEYKGYALFMDSDVIVQGDIAELFAIAEADKSKAVWAVKFRSGHEDTVNHLNSFERAAVLLFNCSHKDNKKLTPEFIEKGEGLHGLKWTDNIGDLPEEWQHVVMYQPPKLAKLIHYTAGIPIWPETHHLGYAKEFEEEIGRAVSAVSYQELMGRSVHHQYVMKIMQERNAKANKEAMADALAKAAMEQGDVQLGVQPTTVPGAIVGDTGGAASAE